MLILQHPQEGDVDLTTVPLLKKALPNAVVAVGLSWASLSQALGAKTAGERVENGAWAVIYPTKVEEGVPETELEKEVVVLDRKGRERAEDAMPIEGIVVLDGTWSQAKTLWWRNPWLLKHNRILLNPREPSIYGRIRKEPRKEYVSTLEAVADALVALGEPEETRASLRRAMRTMVQRARDAAPPKPKATGRPKKPRSKPL